MLFKQVKSYENIGCLDFTRYYDNDFVSEEDIKEAFRIGKAFLKHGFYCKDTSENMTEFFILYRIPTTSINIGLQLLPKSKNTILMREINSAYYYPNPDTLDERQCEILNHGINYYDMENINAVEETHEIDNESALKFCLEEWYKNVIRFCKLIREAEKSEYKSLLTLINNEKEFLENFK